MVLLYIEGQDVTLTQSFTDADGDPFTPTAPTLTVENPKHVISSPEITEASTGTLNATFTADVPGTWFWRWEASDALPDVAEGFFVTRASYISSEGA